MTDQPTSSHRVKCVQTLRSRLPAEGVDAVAAFVRKPTSPPRQIADKLRGHAHAGELGDLVAVVAGVFSAAAIDAYPMADPTRLSLAAFGLALADLADQIAAEEAE